LNLRDADGLISIVGPAVGAVPFGLVLAEPIDFERFGLRPGDLVAVNASDAARWSPRLPTQTVTRRPDVVVEAMRHALGSTCRVSGFAPILSTSAAGFAPILSTPAAGFAPILWGHADVPAGIRELARARRQADLSSMVEAAGRLIGLGPGLTPSGDDLLVGFSAALWSTGDPLAEPFSTRCAIRAEHRTTDVALEFHTSAALGEFSARLHTLLAAIADCDGRIDHLRLSVEFEHAFGWGGSSGADTVLGVLLGLFGPGALFPSSSRRSP